MAFLRGLSFSKFWACSTLVLILVTWPLWWPSGSEDSYPSIPLISAFNFHSLSYGLRGLTVGGLLCLACVIFIPRLASLWWVGVVVCFVLSFLLDQHRLQPWAYQAAIYGVVFACCSRERDQGLQRMLITTVAVSIYVYSAAGKFDYQFIHTVGHDFVLQMAVPVRAWLPEIDHDLASKLAFAFPAIELMAAVGLIVPWCRRAAAWVLGGMHLTLIAMLGPWAADHSLGVLVWNAVMLVQIYWLFLRQPESVLERSNVPRPNLSMIAAAVICFVIVAPLGERWGYWDHWLSWSLYSPHTSRASIHLHASCLNRLPTSLRGHILDDSHGDGWHRVSIEEWSLKSRFVPVYPQARYQLGLARWIAATAAIDREIRVTYQGVSNRWTGGRAEEHLFGKRNLWN